MLEVIPPISVCGGEGLECSSVKRDQQRGLSSLPGGIAGGAGAIAAAIVMNDGMSGSAVHQDLLSA